MKRTLAVALTMFSILSSDALAQGTGKPRTATLKGIADTVAQNCDRGTLARVFTKANDTTVQLYGYSLLSVAWSCRALSVGWMRVGTIARLRAITANLDDQQMVTLLLVPNEQGIWVIPSLSGMVEIPGSANDPHNRAAFNDLIRANKERPKNPEEWVSVALLYLNLMGHNIRVRDSVQFGGPIPGLLSQSPLLLKYHLLPTVAHEGDSWTVVVNDLSASKQTGRYTKWTLTFKVCPTGTLLSDVESEIMRVAVAQPSRQR